MLHWIDRLIPRRGGQRAAPQRSYAQRLAAPAGIRSPEVQARLRARQVDAIKRLSVPLMIVNIVNVAALLGELWLAGQLSPLAVGWAGVVAAIAALSLISAWRGRNRPVPRTTSRRTVTRVIRSAAMFGVLWSVPGLFILPGLSGMALAFGTALLTGMIAGGAIVMFPIPAAATAFLLPVSVSSVIGLALSFGWLGLGPGVLALAFLYVFLGVVRRHSDLFTSEFVARLQLEQRTRLIEDLLEDARMEVLGARRLTGDGEGTATGRLVAGLAHDFNNIFAAIQGHAELLTLEGSADATLVDPIRESCARGADEVRELVAAAGKQVLHPQPVALRPLLDEAARNAATLAPRIAARVEIAPDTPAPFVDAAALRTALDRLARNAANSMPTGGALRFLVRPAPLGGGVQIAVVDEGAGMNAATRARACEPYFSENGLRRSRGLGLAAVAGFVRQSGGRLAIDSAPGAGTTVTLTLPCSGAQARDDLDRRRQAVLVVDGDAGLRDAALRMLQKLGHHAVAAEDAESALALLDSQPVDLVLTNVLLPGAGSGLELARAIRQRPYPVPVAFHSGLSNDTPFTEAQLSHHVVATLATAEL